jgi:hypothetical protein
VLGRTDSRGVPTLLMTKPLAKALGVAPEFLLDPPAVPDYRPSEYLVRQARAEGLEEGVWRAGRSRRRDADADASGQ